LVKGCELHFLEGIKLAIEDPSNFVDRRVDARAELSDDMKIFKRHEEAIV
jgi:hypothetical protein